jgi:hypothetical protein
MILDYLIPYIGIGIFVTIFTDISIRGLKSSKPFTFLEILVCILLWPFILYQMIKGFIDGEY